MSTERRFMEGIRRLDMQRDRLRRIAPTLEAFEALMLEPIVLNDRLLDRERFEREVLAARIPRTLLGRAPDRRG